MCSITCEESSKISISTPFQTLFIIFLTKAFSHSLTARCQTVQILLNYLSGKFVVVRQVYNRFRIPLFSVLNKNMSRYAQLLPEDIIALRGVFSCLWHGAQYGFILSSAVFSLRFWTVSQVYTYLKDANYPCYLFFVSHCTVSYNCAH